MIIKLTSMNDNAILINANHVRSIVSIENAFSGEEYTKVSFRADEVRVKETPSEIYEIIENKSLIK